MAYRSDLQALESRLANLEDELGEVRRKLAGVPPLEMRQDELLASLVEARKGIAELRAAEMLVSIQVARPCPADWDAMQGDDRVRFCSSCRKDVYNLSAMSAAEARALIQEREGNLCARFYRRADGTVLTADCTIGQQRAWAKRIGIAAGVVLAASTGAYAGFGELVTGDVAQKAVVVEECQGRLLRLVESADAGPAALGEEPLTETFALENVAAGPPPSELTATTGANPMGSEATSGRASAPASGTSEKPAK